MLGGKSNAKSTAAFNVLKTEAVGDIFSKSINLNSLGEAGSISGLKLNKAMRAFGDDALRELLGPKQLDSLKRLAGVIGDVTFEIPRTDNPARTAAEVFARLKGIFNIIDNIPGGRFATSFISGIAENSRLGSISKDIKLLKGVPRKKPIDINESNKIIVRILSQLGKGEGTGNNSAGEDK